MCVEFLANCSCTSRHLTLLLGVFLGGRGGLLKLLPKSARKLFVSVFATVIVVRVRVFFEGVLVTFAGKS